jgi:phosphoenolpyruvate-protein kinase (PTS system EI component)
MGFRELSMPAAILPEIKQEILRMDAGALHVSAKKILRTYEPKLIQELLTAMRLQEFAPH